MAACTIPSFGIPAGKQLLFDEVRRLLRRKQERIVEVVVALRKRCKLKAG